HPTSSPPQRRPLRAAFRTSSFLPLQAHAASHQEKILIAGSRSGRLEILKEWEGCQAKSLSPSGFGPGESSRFERRAHFRTKDSAGAANRTGRSSLGRVRGQPTVERII